MTQREEVTRRTVTEREDLTEDLLSWVTEVTHVYYMTGAVDWESLFERVAQFTCPDSACLDLGSARNSPAISYIKKYVRALRSREIRAARLQETTTSIGERHG